MGDKVDNKSDSDDSQDFKPKRVKTAYDEQRIQLERLMENPEQEIEIPNFGKGDESKPRAFHTHEFVRNVMGASAGAGSGEFDIYRGCRRREMLRQEYLTQKAKEEQVQKEFEEIRQAHLREAEERTAKKRAKRLKKKEKLKQKGKASKKKNDSETSGDEEPDQEGEEIELDEKIEDADLNKKQVKVNENVE